MYNNNSCLLNMPFTILQPMWHRYLRRFSFVSNVAHVQHVTCTTRESFSQLMATSCMRTNTLN